jgi:hypothetical protein
MKNRFLLPIQFLLFVAIILSALSVLGKDEKIPDPDSKEFITYVMNKIDDQYRRNNSHGIMEMEVKTKHWTRTLSMEAWSLGRDYSLVRILKPKKEKGTATLKAKNALFTYLSKTGRTIKISSGMMGGSWMGSHFTNDDLIKHTRLVEAFDIKKTFEGKQAGVDIYRFTLIPHPDAPIVWGKIVITVRQSDLEPLSQLFFDEDGKKVRILEFFDHKEMEGIIMPFKMVMKPLDGSGEYTKVQWKKIDFGVKLKKSYFSIQRLRSM